MYESLTHGVRAEERDSVHMFDSIQHLGCLKRDNSTLQTSAYVTHSLLAAQLSLAGGSKCAKTARIGAKAAVFFAL